MQKSLFYEEYDTVKTFLWSMVTYITGRDDNIDERMLSAAINIYVDIYNAVHTSPQKTDEIRKSIARKYDTLHQSFGKGFEESVEMALEYTYVHEPGIRALNRVSSEVNRG